MRRGSLFLDPLSCTRMCASSWPPDPVMSSEYWTHRPGACDSRWALGAPIFQVSCPEATLWGTRDPRRVRFVTCTSLAFSLLDGSLVET